MIEEIDCEFGVFPEWWVTDHSDIFLAGFWLPHQEIVLYNIFLFGFDVDPDFRVRQALKEGPCPCAGFDPDFGYVDDVNLNKLLNMLDAVLCDVRLCIKFIKSSG